MGLLYAGLIIFIGIHLLPAFTQTRTTLYERLGANTYRTVFSVIAFTGLVLIVVGKARAPFVPVWDVPSWGRHFAWLAVFIALLFFAAANAPTNIKRWVRHPMYIGVIVWAGAHLLANGDLASIALFGGLGAWAIVGVTAALARGEPVDNTPISPVKDLILLGITLVIYIVIGVAHPWLFGVPAFV